MTLGRRNIAKLFTYLIASQLIFSTGPASSTAENESIDANSTSGQHQEQSARWWDRLIPPTSTTGDLGRVDVHGFGSWAYADTDGNPYLGGEAASTFDSVTGGLVVSASAFERMRIHTQISAETKGGDSDISLERAFAEWTFADWAKLRGGRAPHPIGIFSEVLDIGTTRPFFDLPQSVYGPIAITGESYDGAGLTGSLVAFDWEISYDVYGGVMNKNNAVPFASALTGPVPTPGSQFPTTETDVIGGRIQIRPPIEGLTFGVSGYKSDIDSANGGSALRTIYGFQFEYLQETFSIRAEYYKGDVHAFNSSSDNAYVMGTIRPFAIIPVGEISSLLDRVEIAAQWNIVVVDGFVFTTPNALRQHEEWAIGLNYWFTPTFVARAEFHSIKDNLFAHDGATLAADLASNRLDTETQLVKVGLEFSF